MRIGVHLRGSDGASGATTVDGLVAAARAAQDRGLELWMPQLADVDSLTALAVIGREVPGLRVGTSCVPIWPRHPMALAMQALTVQAATGNRLTLGVGLSHRPVVEGTYGIPFDQPARRMREYLEVLLPLLAGEEARTGEGAAGRVAVAGACAPRVLVAALGPRMLELAGEVAGGTLLWMVGPRTIASHIVPHLTAAAEAAGRGRPEVLVGLPVCVTADPDAARRLVAADYAATAELPSHRAMLDMEGVAGAADVAVVGDEESVADQLRRLEEAGGTAFDLRVVGSEADRARTLDVLGALAASTGP